jgi:hypothetical protein
MYFWLREVGRDEGPAGNVPPGAGAPPARQEGGSVRRSGARSWSLATLGPVVVVALLVAIPAVQAAAEEPTREEYAAGVEPICKTATKAVEPILKGVKRLVLRNRPATLRAAGRRIKRTSRVRNNALKRIARVPRPPADAARLKRWLGYLHQAQALLARIGRLYEKGNTKKPFSLELKQTRIERSANNTVSVFSFHFCKADSSRFR